MASLRIARAGTRRRELLFTWGSRKRGGEVVVIIEPAR
jgi:hypothetical protein